MANMEMVGQSSQFLDMLDQASLVAPLDRPVLIIGERGTGKEQVAERLHRLSGRWDKPLIILNCAALPESLLEAELFGHEAGAFTGATKARAGRFEEAHGGTLFLDELGTLSIGAQERLLRTLEYGEVQRIGSNQIIRVDVRIIAATNENLPALAAQNRFRADLLDRLSFEVLTLPPLRYRDGDVLHLAEFFAKRMAMELAWARWPGFTPEICTAMEAHHWPGNIRELRNVVERSVYQWRNDQQPLGRLSLDPFLSPWAPAAPIVTHPADTDTSIADALPSTHKKAYDFRQICADHEKRLLREALEQCRFNQKLTARFLQLSYDQLRHAMRRHNLS